MIDGPDRGQLAVLGQGPRIPLHYNLIALRWPVGVGRVEEHQVRSAAQRDRRVRLGRYQGAATAGVPALLRQPLVPRQFGDRAHGFSSVSLNQ